MIDLRRVIVEDIASLDARIKRVAEERDESATPTESTHDQTRQIANQLYNSLLEERARLMGFLNIAKKYNRVFTVEQKKYMIVPDGLGGKLVEDVVLVGEKSPLGLKLKDAKQGDKYEINGVWYLVSETSEV